MRNLVNAISVITLLASVVALTPANALAQDEIVCEYDVIVQDDDWLSKLADEYYGDMFAYPAIVYATNAKASTDDSYATIVDVDNLEPGWRLCIPSRTDAQAIMDTQMTVMRYPERDELAAVIGPVFIYYLDRYFSDVPLRRTEIDRAFTSILDESPEVRFMLQRALEDYKAMPLETKNLLFDAETVQLTTSADAPLDLGLIRRRISILLPNFVGEGAEEAPTAPIALLAENATSWSDPEFADFKIKLSWQDTDDEDGFYIYRFKRAGRNSIAPLGEMELLSSVDQNVTTFVDALTKPSDVNDEYCYRVAAYKVVPAVSDGGRPMYIESSLSNTACSYYYWTHRIPNYPDSDNDGVPDHKDICPGMPGVVFGCPDGDKDLVMDVDELPEEFAYLLKDECPGEWGEEPHSISSDDQGPVPLPGCPVKYKLTWLGMKILQNSDSCYWWLTSFYGESSDSYSVKIPDLCYIGGEEPYLLFSLVNGQDKYGELESWTKRWCCGECVLVNREENSDCKACPLECEIFGDYEPDEDYRGEEGKQAPSAIKRRGFILFGEGNEPALINRESDLAMVVTLMERDWTNQMCFKDQVSLWNAAFKSGGAIGGAIGGCFASAGFGCAAAVGGAIKAVIETLFALDPDPICVGIEDPDDYMGTDVWHITREQALSRTSKNGAYAFYFDMPTEVVMVKPPNVFWGSGCIATMQVRLYFCLYREGIPEDQIRQVCSPFDEVSVVQPWPY